MCSSTWRIQSSSNNNKIEIDAGMVTLRQPLGHERRPARSNGCRKWEGKGGYGGPSGEATEEARPRISRQTAWSARSAAQGALRWHHTARGLCSSWRRITEKRAGSPRARTCPETEAADGHGYRALLWPATLNLVACLYIGGCFQTMLRQAGLSPATRARCRYFEAKPKSTVLYFPYFRPAAGAPPEAPLRKRGYPSEPWCNGNF